MPSPFITHQLVSMNIQFDQKRPKGRSQQQWLNYFRMKITTGRNDKLNPDESIALPNRIKDESKYTSMFVEFQCPDAIRASLLRKWSGLLFAPRKASHPPLWRIRRYGNFIELAAKRSCYWWRDSFLTHPVLALKCPIKIFTWLFDLEHVTLCVNTLSMVKNIPHSGQIIFREHTVYFWSACSLTGSRIPKVKYVRD